MGRGADARSTTRHYPSVGWGVVEKTSVGKRKYSNDSRRLSGWTEHAEARVWGFFVLKRSYLSSKAAFRNGIQKAVPAKKVFTFPCFHVQRHTVETEAAMHFKKQIPFPSSLT